MANVGGITQDVKIAGRVGDALPQLLDREHKICPPTLGGGIGFVFVQRQMPCNFGQERPQLAGTLGRRRIGGMLLIGIAVNAAVAALTGLILHFAADNQIRLYTFWMLGGLDRSEWILLLPAACVVGLGLLILPRCSRELDVLALGEAEAHFAGIDVARLRRYVVWTSAAMVGAAVAVGGMIGFVGLVAPHLVRLTAGPSHRFLVPASGLLGGILLIAADVAARLAGGASELPIGVVTAIIGAPFFLYVLMKGEGRTE